MTTKLLIQNDATSNGDVIVRVANACYVNPPVHGKTIPDTRHLRVLPGQTLELGITDFSLVSIHEEWPSTKFEPKQRADPTGKPANDN